MKHRLAEKVAVPFLRAGGRAADRTPLVHS
jgi:hypothetical protein